MQAKTASGGDARWSYIVDAAQGYLLDGSFVATHPNSSVAEYTATYTRGVRENDWDCLGFDARCRRATNLEKASPCSGGRARHCMIRQGGPSGAGQPQRSSFPTPRKSAVAVWMRPNTKRSLFPPLLKASRRLRCAKRRVVVGRRNHTMGTNRSVFAKFDSAGTLRVRSEWDNQPIARKTRHARLHFLHV